MTTPGEDSDARLLLWGLIALAVCAIAVLFAFTISWREAVVFWAAVAFFVVVSFLLFESTL